MVWSELKELTLGSQCFGCGAPGRSICLKCRASLKANPTQITRPKVEVPIWAALAYEGAVQSFIPAFKDRQALQLVNVLGQLLAVSIHAGKWSGNFSLIPVQSPASAIRKRGYHHVAMLAHEASRWLSPPPQVRLVLQAKPRKDQTALSAASRFRNLHHTMTARPTTGRVVLVDDVITTGATLAEAARAIRATNAILLGVCVIAHTIKRYEGSSWI